MEKKDIEKLPETNDSNPTPTPSTTNVSGSYTPVTIDPGPENADRERDNQLADELLKSIEKQ